MSAQNNPNQPAPKPKINRCIVDLCKMNMLANSSKNKNTLRSAVGLQIEDIFYMKTDDCYIDDIISMQLNINKFYDLESREEKQYFDDFSGKKPPGPVEERVMRNFEVSEKVCGFHMFLRKKHVSFLTALQGLKSFDKKSHENRMKVMLRGYKLFVKRFWEDAYFKFYKDLSLLIELCPVIFDIGVHQMGDSQIVTAIEYCELVNLFLPKPKLNDCFNYFLQDRSVKPKIEESYNELCKQLLDCAIQKSVGGIHDILNKELKTKLWHIILKVFINFCNDITEDQLSNSDSFTLLANTCLMQVFLSQAYHKEASLISNDILFYSFSLFGNSLYLRDNHKFQTMLVQAKSVLESLFVTSVDNWSKSVFEVVVVTLFTNLGQETLNGYKRLPRYRVLRQYNKDGITDITSQKFETDDFLEMLDKIETLKHISGPEVQGLISNFSMATIQAA